jgi:hypothetical protein
LENVFDRLKLADLYQANALKSACGRMIRENLNELKWKPEWMHLKKNDPELAFFVFAEFL